MKLLTEEIRKKIPPLFSQEKIKDPMVYVKFFTPWTNWTWYATEFDGKDEFFGWVVGLEKELGYFSLSELESVRGPGGIGVERDMYFKPKPLSQVMAEHGESWLAPQVRVARKKTGREPLYPHLPKSRGPLFPHVTKSQVGKLPQTKAAEKCFWVEQNPGGSWAIVEAWPGGVVRSPFDTKEEAIKREEEIADFEQWKVRRVLSPQEKSPKQYEALKRLYPYIIIQYQEGGDLIARELIPVKGRPGFNLGELYIITADGQVIREPQIATMTLASTEGNPVSKYCCRLCGECAPPELLGEGRFLDRISWLREHYKEKHPGMWGKMTPMTVEDGERVPPEYRHLAGLVDEVPPKGIY